MYHFNYSTHPDNAKPYRLYFDWGNQTKKSFIINSTFSLWFSSHLLASLSASNMPLQLSLKKSCGDWLRVCFLVRFILCRFHIKSIKLKLMKLSFDILRFGCSKCPTQPKSSLYFILLDVKFKCILIHMDKRSYL